MDSQRCLDVSVGLRHWNAPHSSLSITTDTAAPEAIIHLPSLLYDHCFGWALSMPRQCRTGDSPRRGRGLDRYPAAMVLRKGVGHGA